MGRDHVPQRPQNLRHALADRSATLTAAPTEKFFKKIVERRAGSHARRQTGNIAMVAAVLAHLPFAVARYAHSEYQTILSLRLKAALSRIAPAGTPRRRYRLRR